MTISTQLARQRFTTIPSPLQDAMFSVQTSKVMDDIAQQQKLSEDQIGDIGKIVGWVLLGFFHPEDVSREIQQRLSLSPKIAGDISRSLDAKIFSALKDDLNKAYAPAPISPEEESLAPKIMQEVRPPQAKPTTAPTPQKPTPIAMTPAPAAPAPQIISQTYTATPNVGNSSLSSNRNMAAPAPKPGSANSEAKSSEDPGWSRRTPQEPTVKLGTITPQIPTPTKPSAVTAAAPVSSAMGTIPNIPKPPTSQQPQRAMSEFDRLDMARKASGQSITPAPKIPPMSSTAKPTPIVPTMPKNSIATPTAATMTTAKSQDPAPMILHQQTELPTQTTSGFQLKTPAHDQMAVNMPQPSMSKPAMVEFSAPPKPPSAASSQQQQPNYNQPPQPSPARQITQITAPPPKPAIPPRPPAAPPKPLVPPMPPMRPNMQTPQQPPAPTSGKVIVKDFLG